MKRYTVAQARQRLADVLNEADAGVPVIIERRGTRYRVAVERAARQARAHRKISVEILDPAVEAGCWTWTIAHDGLRFQSRRARRRR